MLFLTYFRILECEFNINSILKTNLKGEGYFSFIYFCMTIFNRCEM